MKVFGTILALGLMAIGAATSKMFDNCRKRDRDLAEKIEVLTKRIDELENKEV